MTSTGELVDRVNALVAAGQADEAVAIMQEEARGGPRAAIAHEWLGVHFTPSDAFAASQHFGEATRLAPEWGMAWVNLGIAQERRGARREALDAYDEALSWAQGPPLETARARRAELEAYLRAHGTACDPFAMAIVAAARKTQPALAELEIWLDDVGRTQRLEPFAAICTTLTDGRRRVHAITVESLMHGTMARVVTGDGARRDAWSRDQHAAAAAGAALAESFEAVRAARPSALDVAIDVLELLARELPSVPPWQLDADIYARGANGQVRVANRAVRVEVTAEQLAIAPLEVELAAPVVREDAAILDSVRAATAAHAAFVARPLGVQQIAPRIAATLRELGVPEHACVPAYRMGPGPALAVFRYEDVELLMIIEEPDGLHSRIGGGVYVAATLAELEQQMPSILQAVVALVQRPLTTALDVDRCYVVTAPFRGLAAGARVKVVAYSVDHGDVNWFVTLVDRDDPTRTIALSTVDESSGADVLAYPERYLRRVPATT